MLARLSSIAALLLCVNAFAALPQPPPDWKIEVVAASPDVQHPSVVCVAPDGRVFVAEDPMDIRLPANSANGRILCFHPNGRRTLFAEKLYAVFGMQYLEGKLYVLHNPKFTVFRDEDGVGKKLFDLIESTHPNPWALDWNDHVPANFKLAMDGYFYIAVGDKGLYGAVGRDGRRVDLQGGGIVRMRPDGTGLEVFCTGVRNIMDVAITAEDEIFTYDNTDEHKWMGRLTHMVDGGFYGYPFDFIPRRNYTLWMMADFGGGAATGTLCYNEDALPSEYHGNLFLADFGKRQILRVRVERDGATFRVASKEEFFRDVPEDFRPVGIAFSADGLSLYICDWQHRDIKADVRVGRLLKVAYQGPNHARPKPEWYIDAASGGKVDAAKAEIFAALAHPSHAVRLTAQRLLKPQDVSDVTNVHALWVAPLMAHKAVDNSNPNVQRQALRVMGTYTNNAALATIEARLSDPDAWVRFAAATTLGRTSGERSVSMLLRAANDTDPWVRHAVSKALNRIGTREPHVWRLIVQDLRNRERREVVFNALRETYEVELLNALIEGRPTDEAAVRLATLIHRKRPEWKGEWWAYHPFRLTPLAKTVEWEGTARAVDFIFRRLTNSDAAARLAAIEGVGETKDLRAVPVLATLMEAQLLTPVLATLNKIGGDEAARIIVSYLEKPFGSETNLQQALKFLEAHPSAGNVDTLERYIGHESEPVRSAALDALVKCEGDAAANRIIPLLKHRKRGFRISAASALGKLRSDTALEALLQAADDADLRDTALPALARNPNVRALNFYVEALSSPNLQLREAGRKAIASIRDAAWPMLRARAENLSSSARKELLSVYKHREEAQRLFATTQVISPEQYLEFAVKATGDAANGRAIFFNAAGGACSQCHAVRNQGGRVGPDLTTIGGQFSRRELAESILYPSKAVREGYTAINIETQDGESFSGLLKGETAEEVQLLDSAGQLHRVAKPRILSRQTSALSLMPEGLHATLTLEQFADLVAYLESLK